MEKVALVTGSSSGIGYQTALHLAREGYRTYATMRDLSKSGPILEAAAKEGLPISVAELDVDSEESISSAVASILDGAGRVDVLVNNAGYMIFGAVEDVPVDEFRAQFETNFFGAIRMIQKVAPAMRRQGGGHIVNISSIAGRIGFPGTPAYISSKFALEGLSECMRYEMDQFGIRVVIIEPGVVKSNLFESMRTVQPGCDSPYADLTDSVISGVRMMAELGTPPSEVAAAVVRAVKERDPLPRYLVGQDAVMFMEAKKSKTDLEFENYLKKELFTSRESR